MDKIKKVAQSMGIITVEDMERYTALELIMMIANKMNDYGNELHDLSDKVHYLLNEGTLAEVIQIFDEWLQDGTFDTLINQSALKKVNDRIDETNAQLSELDEHNSKRIVVKATGVDDSDNIQQALNLIEQGGVVELENGKTFYLTKPINITKSRTTFDGNNNTIVLKAEMPYTISVANEFNTLKNFTVGKNKSWSGDMIHITGNKHTFEKIVSQNQKWGILFKCTKMWDSNFRDIIALNDTDNRTTASGTVFEMNYSVGNDFNNINFGFAETGFLFTTQQEPTSRYKSEGVTITNSRSYYCNRAIVGDFITQLTISNSILDFCGTRGIFVTNGNMLNVDNCWIAVNTKEDCIGIGTVSNFDRATITNNNIIGSSNFTGKAFSIGNGRKTYIHGNTINDINVGVIPSSSRDNRVSMGGVVTYYKQTMCGFQVVGDGSGKSILHNDFDCYFDLYAYHKDDPSQFVYATGRKNVGMQRTISTISNNTLSIGATNIMGTQVIDGANADEIIQVVTFRPVEQ